MTSDSQEGKHRIGKKRNHALDNPCVKEMNASLKCIERNYSDQKKCQKYFDNYKVCNEFWNRVKRDRDRKGISPSLPMLEDRDRIRDEYRKAWGY